MHASPSEDSRASHGIDSDSMVTIAKGKIQCLIAEDANHIYEKRTEAEIQIQVEKILVAMLHLVNSSIPLEMKSTSSRYLETIMIRLFGQAAAFMSVSQYFKGWSYSDMFM